MWHWYTRRARTPRSRDKTSRTGSTARWTAISGAYKRRTHYVLFALGILATIAVNADSVAIAKTARHDENVDERGHGLRPALCRFPEFCRQPATDQSLVETLSTSINGLADRMDRPGRRQISRRGGPGEWLNLLAMHWAGWLLTGLAISFGAPFWFDVLSRFMVVRTTMKPDDKPAS